MRGLVENTEYLHRIRGALPDLTRWPLLQFRAPEAWILIGSDETHLEQVGKLRYDAFVKDGKRPYQADHERGIFLEALDANSLNFMAMREEECVACVRLSWALDALDCPQMSNFITSTKLPAELLKSTTLCSRLVVQPSTKARILVPDLFRHVYRVALKVGVNHSILGARSDVKALFERFGYKATGHSIDDKVAGPINLLCLALRDRGHLCSVKSPLLKVLDQDEYLDILC